MTATVDRDGAFRIDDIPPGKYVLSMRFSQHAAGRLPDEVRFEVPPGDDLPHLAPLDLGRLQLQ